MGHVFKAQLIKLDEIGRSEILQTLSRDAQMVAQGGFMLVMFGQALATVFFLTIYTLFISWVAFFIIVILALVFFAVSLKSVLTTSNTFKEMLAKDSNVHSLFNDFLTGFQEVKMDSRRARDITRHMIDQSRESTEFKGEVLSTMMRQFSYMEVLTFVAIGLLIFLVPEISPGFSDHVLQASTTAMLIVASLSSMVHSMPGLMQANLSARSLFELERRISDEQSEVALKQREIYPMV
jgi:putative ATP-binding cassette transporter